MVELNDEEEGYIYEHLRAIMAEQQLEPQHKRAKYEGNSLHTNTSRMQNYSGFFAERECADCHRKLVKRDPSVTVVCPCSWVWR